MHKVNVSGRQIFLDGKMLKGVQEYQLKNSANEKLAELNLKMVVSIEKSESVELSFLKNLGEIYELATEREKLLYRMEEHKARLSRLINSANSNIDEMDKNELG